MMSKKEQHAQAVKIATETMKALAGEVGPEAFLQAFEAAVDAKADPTTRVGEAWYRLLSQLHEADLNTYVD